MIESKPENLPVEPYRVRELCIRLVTEAVVSYRSTPRILTLIESIYTPVLNRIPHFTSVINWVMRLGLGLIKQVNSVSYPWLAIADHSIDVGTKKALVILRVPMDIFLKREGAVQLGCIPKI